MIKIDENTYNKMPYEIKKHFSVLPNESKNEVLSGFPDSKGGTGETKVYESYDNDIHFNASKNVNRNSYADDGNASRFFYTAKASKKDRDEGLDAFDLGKVGHGNLGNSQGLERFDTVGRNTHPTVKPIELMQYLVRMVAPKGATILDCFMGSNSTGKAVMFENRERNANYKFIGIELTDEYLPICEARIEYAINKYEYDEKVERAKTGQISLFEEMEI